MLRALAFMLAVSLSAGAAGVVQAQSDTAPAILALDSARIGQQRYVLRLLRLPESANLSDPATERCRGISVEESERCLRFRNQSIARLRPVLVLADAPVRDQEKTDLAILVCVGGGLAASDPGRQTIHLWPRAYGLHSVNLWMRDNEAFEQCIVAAMAEQTP